MSHPVTSPPTPQGDEAEKYVSIAFLCRRYPSVVAVPMTQGDIEQASKRIRSDEDTLLDMMLNWPSGSIKTWCESLDWVTETGNPHKSKASRALAKLQRDKLVKKERDKWVLTKTDRKEAQDVIGKGSV